MTLFLHPYNLQSGSAVNFAAAGVPLIGGQGNRYRNLIRQGQAQNIIANWGCHEVNLPDSGANLILNNPDQVHLYSDKCAVSRMLNDNEFAANYWIEHTEDIEVARSWLADNKSVVARLLSRASNGRGIRMIDPVDGATIETHIEGQRVMLWTKYQKKLNEYRVHAGFDHNTQQSLVITAQRKAKRRDAEYVDTRIRNAHDTGAGGWVFLQEDNLPEAVTKCVTEFWDNYCGLDFGGVDVIWNRHYDRAWIVEINTAPGVGVNDVQRYIEYFNSQGVNR